MTLDKLVTRLFDYAGMFPPAALDLLPALKESAALSNTLTRPHMVGADMVVKREHLAQLDDETLRVAGFHEGYHLKVCVVGVPLEQTTDALDRVRSFHAQARDGGIPRRVAALELTSESDLEELEATARVVRQRALTATGSGIALYYEPRWTDAQWKELLPRAIEMIHQARADDRTPVGLKVRCAGPTAVSPDTLAKIIQLVADAHIPFKVTQGLHHPLVEKDRYDFDVGFLGLVTAHRLRTGLGERFTTEQIAACVQESDPTAFVFETDVLEWRGARLSGDDLARALVTPMHIGSCSLREPDEDLVRLFGPPR